MMEVEPPKLLNPDSELLDDLAWTATVAQWEEFTKSIIWKDMKLYLQNQLFIWRNDLETKDYEPGKEIEAMSALRGGCTAIRTLLNLPESFINALGGEPKDE